ncbi:MAG: PIN/TRAM domain-containing protein [Oscillatoriales cyanobacterium]|nr:MAG: PIN/TRAM domain-containing protein [Oscillatoriales cyanobacterium]
MLDAIIIISFIIAGGGIGYYGVELLPNNLLEQVTNIQGLSSVLGSFGALIGFVLGLVAQTTYRRVEKQVRDMPVEMLLTRAIGLIIGLLVANLMLAPLFLLPIPREFGFIKPLVAVLGSVMFGFTGVSLTDTHKVVDTSCIIDGRIENLLETGFLEGQIIIPQFVLQELQLVADSANDQKRVRGRRGLDVLNRIQETYPERIQIHSADYEDIATVDAKLVRFALEIDGILLTNDYNLSKVATVQKLPVLNINDLTHAVRPTYLPGDTIELKIRKEGKEPSQGIGYLDDGTMVVVEAGSSYVGAEARVVVTSALQTSAGRMIFARPQESVIA